MGRIDGAVDSLALGVGERVRVTTRLGTDVCAGDVLETSQFGVRVRSGDVQQFFAADMHLFVVEEPPEPPEVAVGQLGDASLDDRVRAKLAELGEAEAVDPGDEDPVNRDGAKRDVAKEAPKPEEDPGEPKKKDKGRAPLKRPVAEPESAVDPSKLPKDIQDAIEVDEEMDADQLETVMGLIGDAALKALKRAEVPETRLYGLVQELQAATYTVLTGEEPPKDMGAPMKPRKQDGKAKKG